MPDNATQHPPDYLFVYGTLHPDRAPAEIADLVFRFEEVGKGTVAGTLYNLGSYPGAVLDEHPTRRVHGTVFRLPQGGNVLSRLDAYEEFDPEAPDHSLFLRRLRLVQLNVGATLSCWIYEYNRSTEDAAIIESGVYSSRG